MFYNFLYIDPAATTALISGITGVVVALAAVGIILWRKLKKGVNKVLHIDENAKKEVEDELVITEDDDSTEEAQANTVVDEASNEDKQ